jgi:hypothetical protein
MRKRRITRVKHITPVKNAKQSSKDELESLVKKIVLSELEKLQGRNDVERSIHQHDTP